MFGTAGTSRQKHILQKIRQSGFLEGSITNHLKQMTVPAFLAIILRL